ncbi:hypothetical protein QBC37DRAFT_40889 [Rhypophila decipiens]|uniref:Uncharacterized protein n=1 Tax=Rhypophila decipiens TaxID=261697 RepID=A0AAN6YEP6_9PEZI|nr:hypothetical protein QBC37DRAFT_40889 [Rhypophila decipiens]
MKQRIQRECKSPYDGPGRPDFVPVPGTSVEYYDPHQPAQNQGFNENVYEARDAEITEKIRLERETYKSIQPQPLNNQKRYKGFRVCMIRWDMEKTGAAKKAGEVQGDMRVTPEMDKLEKAFGLWGYTVKRLVIPLEDSAAKLEKRLGRFLDKCGEDDLAIVLYIGHGGREKTGSLRFSWKSDDNTMRKIVAWEPMRKQLAAAKQDVLVILDCCFASSAWSTIKKDELGSPEHKRMVR